MLRESEAYGPSSFQSTLSMRRATSCSSDAFSGMIFQSTLSMRRATWTVPSSVLSVLFQSTLSMRRATTRRISYRLPSYFNPRSP